MKTTFNNKVKKLVLTKEGKMNKLYLNAYKKSIFAGNQIYHTYTSGSGRFTTNLSARMYFIDILDALGYRYTEGNDSPRGGKTGDFIKISHVAAERIHSLFTTFK